MHWDVHHQQLTILSRFNIDTCDPFNTNSVTTLQLLAGNSNCALQHEKIYAIFGSLDRIAVRLTGLKIAQPEPRLPIDPDAAIILIRRHNILKSTLSLIRREQFLIVARLYIPLFRKYPDLKEINNFRLGTVVLRMSYP